jgi:hypothetical protein
VSVPLLLAGSLALVAAGVHGVGGEVLVVRRLSPASLPGSRFGGPGMTKAMIQVSWHITTIAFLTVGVALLLSGSVLEGAVARGVGVVAAGASTGFAAVAMTGALLQGPRTLLRHGGPLALTLIAVLAWAGLA